MKREDLNFSNRDKMKNIFLNQCLFNDSAPEYPEAMAIVDSASSTEEVINKILNSDTMRGSQIYAELSKDRADHWRRLKRDITTWQQTISDIGGLKIGNDSFSINIPNGYGDGDMYYTVLGKGCFNHDMLDYFTSVRGTEINIYDYDCGDEILETISGRFGIYYGYGFVVLEKWD